MQGSVLKGFAPWLGLGAAILAAGLYFCGYAETGVLTFTCAVGLVGAAVFGVAALAVLFWVVGGLWRDVIRFRSRPAA